MSAAASFGVSASNVIQLVLQPEEVEWRNVLEPLMVDNEKGAVFLQQMYRFLKERRDPNLTFPLIGIGENTYRNASIFHVVYIYWKSPGMNWSADAERYFEYIIDQMLDDSLFESEHFVPRSEFSREEGYSLERMTIAHYAAAINDFSMVDKVLQRAPDLINKPCCLVQGKGSLGGDFLLIDSKMEQKLGFASWEKGLYIGSTSSCVEALRDLDDEISGDLALGAMSVSDVKLYGLQYPVTRITKVTLLHLAARVGAAMTCTLLLGKGACNVAPDSTGKPPKAYLETSFVDGFVKRTTETGQLISALTMVRLKRPVMPETGCVLWRGNYMLNYDAGTRVARFAYEKLTPKSLVKNVKRESSSFKVDPNVPKENRTASTDYTNSGYDRGHLVPAADAVASEAVMEATFILTNICPQNPQFNRNYWKRFEKEIRVCAHSNELLEVFTGGVFVPKTEQDGKMRVSYEVIGKSGIAVPTHYFKVIYVNGAATNYAYLLPNEDISMDTPLSKFKTAVEVIQKLSGILFSQWR
jgi:endonuclease G